MALAAPDNEKPSQIEGSARAGCNAGDGAQAYVDAMPQAAHDLVSDPRSNAIPFNGWQEKGEKLKSLWKLLGRSIRDPRLTRGDIAILYSIADRVSDRNVAWPGFGTLSNDAGVSRSTAIRSVGRLEECGYLMRESGGVCKSNRYRLTGSTDATSSADATSGADATGVVAPMTLGVVAPMTPESASLNLPIESTSKKALTKGSRKPKTLPMAIPDWLPAQAWIDWHEYRQERTPKGWTQKAQELSVSTLMKLKSEGHDPVKVIEASIGNGWSGLFPLKSNNNNVRGSSNANQRQPGESLADYSARINGAHDEREAREVGYVL